MFLFPLGEYLKMECLDLMVSVCLSLNNLLSIKKNSVVSVFLIDLCEFFTSSEHESFVRYMHSKYLLVCDLPFHSDNGLHFSKSNLSIFFMASVLLRRSCVHFEAASSSLSHRRLSFSPNHTSPDLCVLSHVMWS